MSTTIEQVKREVMILGLGKVAIDCLWNAKGACDDAVKGEFRFFEREIQRARNALDRAEEMINERKRLADTPPEVPR